MRTTSSTARPSLARRQVCWHSGTERNTKALPTANSFRPSYDGSRWSPTTVVTNSSTVSRDIGLTVKSVANPVPFRRSPTEIWLFFSASRLSGWATSEILLMRSHDNGLSWGPAKGSMRRPS